jgi:1-piperideine-2-carboxylate/1-pyrroline-2-carboxylate reductase [NAD(P)H]
MFRPLDAESTARALPWAELLLEIAAVCREHRAGDIDCPPRQVLPLPGSGTLLLMPALSPQLSITKRITVHPGNRGLGLPTIQGEVVVIDSATGAPLLQLDGPTVTARRTAAVSLLAVQLLVRRPLRRVLIIGAGAQAAAHAEALQALHPQARLFVHTRSGGSLPFTEPLADPAGLSWDLVIAATTSKTPVLPPGVGEGGLVIGVGAFRHDMIELPPALVAKAQVFVDDPAGAQAEAGDLLAAGLSAAQCSLEDLVMGHVPEDDGRTRVFKSVGCARWDLAAARVAVLVLRAGASP